MADIQHIQIISRKQAIKNKLKFYFTGKPCNRKHVDFRHTYNGVCLGCQAYWVKKRDKKPHARGTYNKERSKVIRSTEKYKANKRKWRKNPRVRKADNANLVAWRAVQNGELIKLPCEVCGRKKSEAHHCDYNKPLDVMWLCKRHHTEWHLNHKPIY